MKNSKKILSAFLSLAMVGTMFASIPFSASAATTDYTEATGVDISYASHVQHIGWQDAVKNGAESGTEGKAYRDEAIAFSLSGANVPSDASLTVQVHGQTYGWQTPKTFKAGQAIDLSNYVGTTGQKKRIEAIKITLNNMPGYAVVYRAHCQSIGWTDWVETENGTAIENAAMAGTTGKAKRLEALEVKVICKKPMITSAVATSANTVKVNFSTPIKDVDFNNFSINGDLIVTEAALSADKTSVVLTVNGEFTKDQEYTVTASDITSEAGIAADGDLKATFKWSVAAGVTVSLSKTTIAKGGTADILVKDQDGKDVTNATVIATSTNEYVAKVDYKNASGTPATPSDVKIQGVDIGTAEIRIEVTLADGSKLVNSFEVTVPKATTTVAGKGFTLVGKMDDAPANTVAFLNTGATTSMFVGDTKYVAYYTYTNGDPDISPFNFKGYTVRSSNATVATAVVDTSNNIVVKAINPGTATFTATNASGDKKSFTVEVKKAPELTTIGVSATSVKLSDECKGDDAEGVSKKTVAVTLLDQYGNSIAAGDNFGKVTVSSSTDGLTIDGVESSNVLAFEADDESNTFTIQAITGKIVNGTVTVNYFKNKNDAKPAVTKTISVKVVDVDSTNAKYSTIEVNGASEIDVNAPNINIGTDTYTPTVYVLDQNGNRFMKVKDADVKCTLNSSNADVVSHWLTVSTDSTNKVTFKDTTDTDPITLLRTAGTAKIDVTAAPEGTDTGTGTGTITKTVSITYKNTAVVPVSATVSSKSITVKLNGAGPITSDELLFGVLDGTQLVQDTDSGNIYIAVKSSASNGGYKYNKPLVTIKSANGKEMPLAAGVYGIDSTSKGSQWAVSQSAPVKFSSDNLTADCTAANIVDPENAISVSNGIVTVDLSSAKTASFTLVVNKIYVGNGTDNTYNNILSAPVSINITVTK